MPTSAHCETNCHFMSQFCLCKRWMIKIAGLQEFDVKWSLTLLGEKKKASRDLQCHTMLIFIA